jgi:hypothetical protein
MISGEAAGFDPNDIADMSAVFAAVDAERQRQLPYWFKGLPLDSAPAAMALDLTEEIIELTDASPHDPYVIARKQTSSVELSIMVNFHIGHRKQVETGVSPVSAIYYQANSIREDFEKGAALSKGHDIEEFNPYLEEIVEAYLDFYVDSYLP